MPLCKRDSDDALLKQLVMNHGINLLVPPRSDIQPGDMIISDESGLARRADYLSVFGIVPKAIVRDNGVPESLSFNSSSELAADTAANISGSVLSSFGIAAAKFKAAFSRQSATRVILSLIAPQRTTLFNLDEMIEALREKANDVPEHFGDRRFFIVTDVFKAKGIRIETLGQSKQRLTASGEIAEEISIGSSLGVSADADGSYAVRAKAHLAFGITVQELELRHGMIQDKAADIVLKVRGDGNASNKPSVFIDKEDAFVELKDWL